MPPQPNPAERFATLLQGLSQATEKKTHFGLLRSLIALIIACIQGINQHVAGLIDPVDAGAPCAAPPLPSPPGEPVPGARPTAAKSRMPRKTRARGDGPAAPLALPDARGGAADTPPAAGQHRAKTPRPKPERPPARERQPKPERPRYVFGLRYPPPLQKSGLSEAASARP